MEQNGDDGSEPMMFNQRITIARSALASLSENADG
jgi:hypothetical protein